MLSGNGDLCLLRPDAFGKERTPTPSRKNLYSFSLPALNRP